MSETKFSIVSAVYNVAVYLPEFLRSLDEQQFPYSEFEVVLVDDGSTDGSSAILREWAGRTHVRATVLYQPNAGQGSARNRGLDVAIGEWITFSDPDDVLPSKYLASVAEAMARFPQAHAVACAKHYLYDTGETSDSHPLRDHFGSQSELHRLDKKPFYFFMMSSSAFYRRDRIGSLRFDTLIRPIFEDGHFTGRYLLAVEDPRVLFVPETVYLYRQRVDNSSSVQRSLTDPRRFTVVLERGYLDLLERAASQGRVPLWLQHMVIYDLSWIITKAMQTSDGFTEEATPQHDAVSASRGG